MNFHFNSIGDLVFASLKAEVEIIASSNGRSDLLRFNDQFIRFPTANEEAQHLLQSLRNGGVSFGDDLSAPSIKAIQTLSHCNLLEYSIQAPGGVLTMRPTERSPIALEPINEGEIVRNYHTYMTFDGDQACLQTPLSVWVLRGPGKFLMDVWSHFEEPQDAAHAQQSLCETMGISDAQAQEWLGLLLASKLLARSSEPRNEDKSLARWEFHDILMHTQSRSGRHDKPVGRVFPFAGVQDPLPALKRHEGKVLKLPEPDYSATERFSLDGQLKQRRTRRDWVEREIPLDVISRFLHRVFHVQEFVPIDGEKQQYETTRRPYPSGGGCHPLEVYLLSEESDDTPSQVRRYLPDLHALEEIEHDPNFIKPMFARARLANGTNHSPPLLVVFAARFGRVDWKYRSISYATILKDAGVLIGYSYLSAEVEKLACCAFGDGSILDFEKLTGENWLEEGSVAELGLGYAAD